jgi:formamidopyrimidine-DNA glycosylase
VTGILVPELPEVETTCRGIAPLVTDKVVERVLIHNASLRWPVSDRLPQVLPGQRLQSVSRRSKYLLFGFDGGTLIVHLGMTGHLRVAPVDKVRRRHDHVEIVFCDGSVLRYNDSRRFGAMIWTTDDPLLHERLANLGPEPGSPEFNEVYLHKLSRSRQISVKLFLMDARVVVGIGNIYANEALFRAGIHPARRANQLSRPAFSRLVQSVRQVLDEAIAAGGTTIRNFSDSQGRPGYFKQELRVYGRAGQPCPVCGSLIKHCRLGQRSTYFCRQCQK